MYVCIYYVCIYACKFCAQAGVRTHDPGIQSHVFYQLSQPHGPVFLHVYAQHISGSVDKKLIIQVASEGWLRDSRYRDCPYLFMPFEFEFEIISTFLEMKINTSDTQSCVCYMNVWDKPALVLVPFQCLAQYAVFMHLMQSVNQVEKTISNSYIGKI